MTIHPNAPAFPVPLLEGETIGQRGGATDPNGLTIRAHFAAMAMQGQLAAWPEGDPVNLGQLASNSVKCADALITELSK